MKMIKQMMGADSQLEKNKDYNNIKKEIGDNIDLNYLIEKTN